MEVNDFGPIYAETLMGRFPVEPWNTASNLIFLVLILHFSRKTRLNIKVFPVLVLALPILLTGFVGGTVFHATRSNRIWLLMDFLPIMILAILASVYFWESIVPKRIFIILVVLAPLLFTRALHALLPLPMQIGISLNYAGLAFTILLPAILHCRKNNWRGKSLLTSAAMSFGIAIIFRVYDKVKLLPMGTHFLWHIFGGISSYFLMEYIFQAEKEKSRSSI